jgi:hypothetical protein
LWQVFAGGSVVLMIVASWASLSKGNNQHFIQTKLENTKLELI